MSELITNLVKPEIVVNALKIALFVGLLLNVINQGRQFLNGFDIAWGQVFLNFLVPYCVASYSAAKHAIEQSKF